MSTPLVSILIASYNQEKFIAQTLSSALEQNFENLEVIVSDDASTDATPDIIMDFYQKYPTRLIPIFGKENLGITRNCNRALHRCRGKYIALQGGDDVLLPGKIETQTQFMEDNQDVAISYHEVEVFDSLSNKTLYYYSDRHAMRRGTVEQLLRYASFCCSTSVMLRAKNIPSYGYDENIPNCSDYLLLLDVLLADKNNKIDYIDGVYARYRRHDKNITNSIHLYGFGESMYCLNTVMKKAPWLKRQIKAVKWERTFIYAIKNGMQGKYKNSFKLFLRALRTYNLVGFMYALENALNYVRFRFKVCKNEKK